MRCSLAIDLSILSFYQTLLFRLCFKKYVNNLVIYPKGTLAKFKADFSCNFRIFDHKYHGQTSVRIKLVMLDLLS